MADGLISAIEPQQRRGGKRSNVYVDGRYAFSLQSELAATLRVGQPVSEVSSAKLLWDDEFARCYDSALVFLTARPRSEREVRRRLGDKGYQTELIDCAIEKLRGLDLIDDAAFGQYWVEQRQAHRPRGARMLKLELRQKGLSSEAAGEAVAELGDESESAYQVAARKAQSLRALDERTFKQRLGAFLQRRGFDYEVAGSVVRRLWHETRP